MKVVFILSDANRWDYINYMPFLKEQSNRGYFVEKIIPGIGFCEISEYISGLPSTENGNLFQITFKGKYGPRINKGLKNLCSITNKIPKIRWKIASKVDNYLKRSPMIDESGILNVRYAIPIDLISYFKPTESLYEYDDIHFFPNLNLLQKIKAKGHSYDIDDFVKHNKVKGTDEERLVRLQEKIKNKNLKDFTLLYIGKGEVAHETGTDDKFFHKILYKYDKVLRDIYKLLVDNYGDKFIFVFLGDHGMVNVKKYINPTRIIKDLQKIFHLVCGEDFVYFVDSTCLRFWFREKSVITDANTIILKHIGDYVDNSVDTKLIDSSYGDLIYIVKPGVMFFPDFFNLKKKKGMHGYQNTISDQWGICICMGNVTQGYCEQMHLYEINDFIYNFFDEEM